MAAIVIKDLQESIELDRKAMLKIAGGRGRLASTLALRQEPSKSNVYSKGGDGLLARWLRKDP